MNNIKYLRVYLFVFFIFNITTISAETKTSSECWACKPNTPHVLNCTGAGVIVILSAHYGYKAGCGNGITRDGCTVNETERCCKPGGPSKNCFKSFNVRDREELEATCSNKSTCTFNSIRHDQPFDCIFGIYNNSFTLIKYTCQTLVTSLPTISSSTNNPADTTSLDVKTSDRPPPSKETTSSDDRITSGEVGGIVVGVFAIVILLFIAAFLLHQRHETKKSPKYYQSEQNHQQSTTRTVGIQYSETDFNALPNIATSSSDVSTSYSQLNRLGTESSKYDDLILNNGRRNAITDNNSDGYYNQQYVNM